MAAWKKGKVKTGGRKAGTPNRATSVRAVQTVYERLQQIIVAMPALPSDRPSVLEVVETIMWIRYSAGDYGGALVAANILLPYVHARLSQTDLRITNTYAALSDEEIQRELRRLEQKYRLATKLIEAEPVTNIPAAPEAAE